MAATLQAVVSLNRSGFDSGLKGMSQLTSNLTGAMSMAFGGVASEILLMGRAFGPMGVAVGVLKEAIDIGQEFQQQMANVSSVTGLMGDELASVGVEARKFAENTAFSATEAGKALYSLASAGFSSAAALKDMLTPALLLAGATQADAQRTTETLTATMAAFRLETESAGAVADLFAGAVARSPATMDRLSEAMSQAAPVAAAFGVGLEDTVASIAAFHTVGIRGAEAGTAFRQAMTKLAQEMNKTDSVIGDALKGWQPDMDGLTGAIVKLEAAGITGAQAMEELGVRGGKAVAAQLALGSDAIKKLQTTIAGAGDVTKMYNTQMDTVNSQWKIFTSMMKESGLQLWDNISDEVMATVKAMQAAALWVRNLSQDFRELFASITAGQTSFQDFLNFISPLINVLNNVKILVMDLITGIDLGALGDEIGQSIASAFTSMGNALANFINTDLVRKVAFNIGVASVAISKIVADAVVEFLSHSGEWAQMIVNVITSLMDTIKLVIDGRMTAISDSSAWLQIFKKNIEELFAGITDDIISSTSSLGNRMDNLKNSMIAWIMDIDLAGIGVSMGQAVSDAMVTFADLVTGLISSDLVQKVIFNIGVAIGAITKFLFSALVGFFSKTDERFTAMLDLLIAAAKAIASAVVNAFKGIMTGIVGTDKWDDILAANILLIFLNIKKGILANAGLLIGAITDVVTKAKIGILTGILSIADTIKADWLSDKIQESIDKINTSGKAGFDGFVGSLIILDNEILGVQKTMADLADASANTAAAIKFELPAAVTAAAASLDEFATESTTSFDGIKNSAGGIITPLDGINNSFGRIKETASGIIVAVKDLAGQSTTSFGEIRDSAGNLLISLDDLRTGFGEIFDAQGNLIASLDTLNGGSSSREDALIKGLEGFTPTAPGNMDTTMARIADSLDKLVALKGVLWA